MSKPIWKPSATAVNNGDFVSIQAYSGYTLAMADPEATEYLFEPAVSDAALGKAVFNSLKQSRSLPIEEARIMSISGDKHYAEWVQKLMAHYDYKTKRALFKNMKNCTIELHENLITIRPTHHDKLEGWSGEGVTEESYVKIPANSPSAEIGAALRLAFSRCTGMGA